MSRRWFLGATLGAVAGAVVAPPTVQVFNPDVFSPVHVEALDAYVQDLLARPPLIMDLVYAQIEKVRPKLRDIFEMSDEIAMKIAEASPMRASRRSYRIPIAR